MSEQATSSSRRLGRPRSTSTSSTKKPRSKKPVKKAVEYINEDEEDVECPTCENAVTEEDQALQCELCQQWYHCSCEAIKKRLYEAINEDDDDNQFTWVCKACRRGKKFLFDAISAISIEQQRLATEVKELKTKQTDTDSSLQAVKKSVNKLEKQQASATTDVLKETKERQKREDQLMAFHCKESVSEDVVVRKADDIRSFSQFCSVDLEIEVPEVVETWRVGEKNDKGPRPLKIKLKNKEDKQLVMKTWWKLSPETKKRSKLAIALDRTPMQQKENRALVEDCKKKQSQLEENGITNEKWVIREDKIKKIKIVT